MGKVRVTYLEHTDPKERGSAVETTFMGVKFMRDQPVEMDDDEHAELIAKARNNPTWRVEPVPAGKGKAKEGQGGTSQGGDTQG